MSNRHRHTPCRNKEFMILWLICGACMYFRIFLCVLFVILLHFTFSFSWFMCDFVIRIFVIEYTSLLWKYIWKLFLSQAIAVSYCQHWLHTNSGIFVTKTTHKSEVVLKIYSRGTEFLSNLLYLTRFYLLIPFTFFWSTNISCLYTNVVPGVKCIVLYPSLRTLTNPLQEASLDWANLNPPLEVSW